MVRPGWLAFLLISVALAGCAQTDEAAAPLAPAPALMDDAASPATKPPAESDAGVAAAQPQPADDALRFIALGDQGTGGEGQYQVARAIEQVCAARGCEFALALGDNIYEIGVEDEYDPQFEAKFELPYANLDFPFYLALGNHDNSHDPISGTFEIDAGIGHWYESGNYEVAYTHRDDRMSEKWTMPDRYYNFTKGDVSFVGLDTNTLMYYGQGFTTDITFGQQEAWAEATLDELTTPWRIAFGHHPYLSNGEHGNAGNYDGAGPTPVGGTHMQEFFETVICNNVDLYISGHDHDLQWLKPAGACDQTQLIVSGAAAKTRSLDDPERNEAYFQTGDQLGFLWIEIQGDQFTGIFHDEFANVLYEGSFTRP